MLRRGVTHAPASHRLLRRTGPSLRGAARMDVELGATDGSAAGAKACDAFSSCSSGSRRRPRQCSAGPSASAEAAAASVDVVADGSPVALRTNSGDSAAFPSKTMNFLKLGILLLLLASLAVGASLAYITGTDSESRSFRLQFEASVDQLRADFQQRLHIQVKSATMAAKYIAGLPDKGVGLGVYIPGFQTFADDVLAVTDASVASWLTLVLDEERPAFELRAQEAASRIDPTGAFLREVQTRGIGQRSNASAAGGINNFVRRDQAPFYVTAWANTPRNLTRGEQYYLFDAYSDPLRRVTLDRMMANSQPAMTDLTDFTFADPPGTINPSSVIFAPAWTERDDAYGLVDPNASVPVFNASDANITYSRACSAVAFHWSAVLGGSLPRFIDGIVAVLHSPEGRMFTFSVSGRSVKTVGYGDLHRGLSGNLASLGRRLNVTAAGSEWSLTLYPTEALRRQYSTSKPRNNALGIGATMLATALLFIYYELFDRRRTARVHARLLAYVHQLEAMQRALADGCAREAEAKARVLAEEASSRQKDQFVAMVSHEIRTPLNAVGGATALLGGTPLNEEQRELVALLEAGCAHVILIVEDILLHGSLVSGAFSVARERVALSRAVLDPAWRMVAMQPAARAKLASLRLSRSVAEDVPPVILGDATRLTQVIVNLLSNALKFTPAGGAVELLVDVTSDPPVAAAQDGASSPKEEQQRWLRFRVRDTGIGVSPEQLQRIFEPFVQAEQSTVRRFGGTGLGLTICRRLARAMGGDLVAESAGDGAGTTLAFTIPLLLPGEPSPPPSPRLEAASMRPSAQASGNGPDTPPRLELSAEPSYEPPPLLAGPPSPRSLLPPPPVPSALSVLVAEDDPLSQTVMRKLLSRLGVRFTVVENGQLAVHAFLHDRFNLVLLDLHMPLLDGLGAARQMCAAMARGEAPTTPLYALTASCSDEERARCSTAGMQDLIAKPIRIDGLKALLRKHAHPPRSLSGTEQRVPYMRPGAELGI